MFAEASVKLRVDDEIAHTVAEGDGPVNALDQAIRKALLPHYPKLKKMRLSDFKVRIIDGDHATAAAFVAFSSVGILTAIRLLRATLKGRADRRGNLKGSLSINAEVESAARDIDALNDYQERRYRGEE